MAKKYLDYDGLLYFWQKLKTAFSTKAEGVKTITRSGTTFTVTRADDTTFTFTQQDNTVAKTTTTPKMNGTAAIGSETKYAAGDHVHPTDTSRAPLASPALTGTPTAPTAAADTDNTQIATTAFVHDVVDALDTGVSDVKIGTTSIVTDGVATIPESGASTTGLMTGAQYTKLNGIAAGAEVNQNAFSNVKVGSTTVAADSKTDTLELAAGTNISLTPDADSDKVTIGFSGSIPTKTTTTPKMNGTAAVGSETKYAAGDHVHPSDTSRVPTTRKVNGKALSSDVTLTGEDIAVSSDSESATVYTVIDGLGTALGNKVDKVAGKGLSTNDYTTTEKNKLSGIASGAEVNQNAFSTISVKESAGSTTTVSIEADSKTDTLSILAGNNMSITANSTDDSITLSPVFLIAGENNDGLMSSAQASKLAGIAEGADKYIPYCECDTSAATVQKDATIRYGSISTLTKGAQVLVRFANSNTATNPKLKVGSTDAKFMLQLAAAGGYSYIGKTEDGSWRAGAILLFTYDGTGWVYTGRTYNAFTGVETGSQTPAFGATFSISQIKQGIGGQITGTTRTVKIPDTTATTSAAGLMSSADKTKLDDISGSTLDIVAGTNVTITPDTTNGTLTIASTDTKTTAGSGDSSSKLFIVGATSQSSSGVTTYSQDTAYVGTDGHLYSNSKQAVNLSDSQALTNKTYNGYTLKAACAKGVVTSISSDSTDLPTVTAVKNYVSTAVTGAAAFQGTAPTTFAPTNYKAGWYWVIGTAGTYAGQVCEPGDMIFATKDYATAYAAADFDVIQTNLDITSITNAEIDTIVAA